MRRQAHHRDMDRDKPASEAGTLVQTQAEKDVTLHIRSLQIVEALTQRTEHIIDLLAPNGQSEVYRNGVFEYLRTIVASAIPDIQLIPYGSFSYKAYLPDSDIDVCCYHPIMNSIDVLNKIKVYLDNARDSGGVYPINHISIVRAKITLIKCTIGRVGFDISFANPGSLVTTLFIERMCQSLGRAQLAKRSFILIQAWCYHEARIIGGHNGMLSSYAVRILIMNILLSCPTIVSPLQVLVFFLGYYSCIDWDTYAISLFGSPVPLSNLTSHVNEIERLVRSNDGMSCKTHNASVVSQVSTFPDSECAACTPRDGDGDATAYFSDASTRNASTVSFSSTAHLRLDTNVEEASVGTMKALPSMPHTIFEHLSSSTVQYEKQRSGTLSLATLQTQLETKYTIFQYIMIADYRKLYTMRILNNIPGFAGVLSGERRVHCDNAHVQQIFDFFQVNHAGRLTAQSVRAFIESSAFERLLVEDEYRDMADNSPMTILDPIYMRNNLGKTVTISSLYRIKSVFYAGFTVIGELMEVAMQGQTTILAALSDIDQMFINILSLYGSGCSRPDMLTTDASVVRTMPEVSLPAIAEECIKLSVSVLGYTEDRNVGPEETQSSSDELLI